MKIKKVLEKTELPFGIIGNYYIEIFSDNEIVITGKTEVLKLDNTVLKLKVGPQIMEFCGDKINISCFTIDGLKITGNISRIEFIQKEKLD